MVHIPVFFLHYFGKFLLFSFSLSSILNLRSLSIFHFDFFSLSSIFIFLLFLLSRRTTIFSDDTFPFCSTIVDMKTLSSFVAVVCLSDSTFTTEQLSILPLLDCGLRNGNLLTLVMGASMFAILFLIYPFSFLPRFSFSLFVFLFH